MTCLFIGLLLLLEHGFSYGEKTELDRRLENLRTEMTTNGWVAYVIPNSDYHNSETPMERDRRRAWISGFLGSAGDAAITLKEAALATDSRYFIQAKRELPSSWTLLKGNYLQDWLSGRVFAGDKVAADPKTMSYSKWIDFESAFEKNGATLVPSDTNLVDKMWDERPIYPSKMVFIDTYTDQKWESKLERIMESVKKEGCSSIVMSSLEDIAWALNLRGSDVPNTPVFASFFVLTVSDGILYVRSSIMDEQITARLRSSTKYAIQIKNYEEFWIDWKTMATSGRILIPSSSSYFIYSAVPADNRVLNPSPVINLRAYKTKQEVKNSRRAHIADGLALCRLFKLIEDEARKGIFLTELEVAELSDTIRKKDDRYVGLSFPSIVAFGPNAALPHYHPQLPDVLINEKKVLLLDTGGQYYDGTTDVTRVLHLGKPSKIEIEVYTTLLRGVSRLGSAVFPPGASLQTLDILVREPLYQLGLGYTHGSTHGTGVFLGVHEHFNNSYEENFIGSQEPGYYDENNFGMRLENLVVVEKAKTKYAKFARLLTFSALTKVPYEKKLINKTLMDASEIEWVNSYHRSVLNDVGQIIDQNVDKSLYQWLEEKTEPILK